jgi:cytoskeletal protein CcmA (bactofilin family)
MALALEGPFLQGRKGFILSAMWKPTQSAPTTPSYSPEPVHPAQPAPAVDHNNRAQVSAGDQATISKGLTLKGEITGSESLFVDGKIEGSISLLGNRVTVGHNGQVAASIAAREIVILGKVRGNISATDRVEIRAEGALTGDVTAARISIEDGAYFKGGIDIKKPEGKPGAAVPAAPEAYKPAQS